MGVNQLSLENTKMSIIQSVLKILSYFNVVVTENQLESIKTNTGTPDVRSCIVAQNIVKSLTTTGLVS